MYHGAVAYGRGIEKCVEVLRSDDDLLLFVLGPSNDKKYRAGLENFIRKKDLENRVLFKDAVPQRELWKWIGAADAEMVIAEPVGRSYYLSLPNKLFESIQAHVPIIASDLPEIAKLVHRYNVGLTVDPNDVNDIAEKISLLKKDNALQKSIRQNEIEASEELNWEKEKTVLREAFKRYG